MSIAKPTKKPNAISLKRNGRSTDIRIEGSVALIVLGLIAVAYIAYLLH